MASKQKPANQPATPSQIPATIANPPSSMALIDDMIDHFAVDKTSALTKALTRAGTLTITTEESFRLREPFPQDRESEYTTPRGLTLRYIPHIEISRRLNDVLGVGQWAIIRLSERLDVQANVVYGSYALIVRGVWVGDSVAGHPYHPTNRQMDYADALESTRGVALRRIAAKSLGCGDQVWARDDEHPRVPVVPFVPSPAPAMNDISQVSEVEKAACLKRLQLAASYGTNALCLEWTAIGIANRKALAKWLPSLKEVAIKQDAYMTEPKGDMQ